MSIGWIHFGSTERLASVGVLGLAWGPGQKNPDAKGSLAPLRLPNWASLLVVTEYLLPGACRRRITRELGLRSGSRLGALSLVR